MSQGATIEKETVQQIKLFYDVYVPGESRECMPLLVCFHGYEGNKESMMAKARAINHRDFVIASVQAPNSFFVRNGEDGRAPRIGFGWMMQYKAEETIKLHHQTLASIIEGVHMEYQIDLGRVFLLAFSQSVSLNYRFAFSNPDVIRGVIGVCGGIPGDWSDAGKYRASRTDALIIAGHDDEFYPIDRAKTFKQALELRARQVDFYSFPVGHAFPNDALPLINGWLLSRIE